ncbi:type VII secretion-associated serine protease mycosin [Saccharopolyspora gloriosae]|uniref:Type VII secretion-associated serine protease mycosin n=1 Tax=Saccharopolyspora gloriosae TaxID=455344 RepID=A0A840NDY1_9PSEU|nr:type VII secretion-associated serine protease mycosin [Saccharopolyspora gloriosae]MBB5069171.1 type VII secretion-associated serine protease mycosin [Saccharopolyspora gloriosae]
MRASRPVLAALGVAGMLLTAAAPAAAVPGPQLPRTQATGTDCRPPPVRTEVARPWAQQLIAPERAWELTRGQGVLVGVIDSGVDASIPQLAGGVLVGHDVYSSGGGPANTDCLGHGTFVAGIIAARQQPGVGFAGVAPDAQVLPIRDTQSTDGGSAHTMAEGIRTAVNSGVKVINISESTYYDDQELRSAIEFAQSRDVLVVAAVANGAQEGNPIPYPASYPGVLAVGAVDSSGARANFSQTGDFVALVAPGVDVMSLGPGGPGHWQDSGTSFATPFVTGTAALVRSYHPELTAEQVKYRLQATATRPGVTVPDPQMGWGTVNPYSAVTAVLPEEGGAAAGGTPAGRAAHPDIPVDNPVPMRVVTLSIAGLVLVVIAAVIGTRLGPVGHQRRWRRRRVVKVVDGPQESAPE